MIGGGYAKTHVLGWRDEPKPAVFDGVEVRAAGDEHYVVAALQEACANGAADTAGSVDDVPRGLVHNARAPVFPARYNL